MAVDNFITDIEATLKSALSDANNVNLNGEPVPVKIVTPDCDFVEVIYPSFTLKLTDVRRDLSRTDNQRNVTKDIVNMQAKVRGKSEPYNLHYTISAHTKTSREDRLLLGELIYFIDAHPVMRSAIFDTIFYLHRDVTFREVSDGRNFVKSLGIVVKTRAEARLEEIVPLVQERKINVIDINRKIT